MSLISLYEEMEKIKKTITESIDNVTLIFVDMTGSTTYKDEKGNELGVGKVIRFNLDVTKIIKVKGEEYKQSGEIEKYEICKYIGDEVMAYFKGKSSSKIAVEIAVYIQEHFKDVNKPIRNEFDKYKPKIGIDFGEVLFVKYDENLPLDPHGLIVDRASRIISLAKPYQILISEAANNQAKSEISANTSEKERKKFKGIKGDTEIREVVWDKELGPLGIKFEEEPFAFMIPANEPAVYQFIKDNNLLECSKQIDLFLYTYETLSGVLRYDLEDCTTPITFRILIRNPSMDSRKASFIHSSISTMVEIISVNPIINFNVRFYNEEPLLRTYIFKKEIGESEGLLGLYKYDPNHPMRFIGAEYNYLIHTKGRSTFENNLLNLFQSRFDYTWDKLTDQKAIIFDLDGVITDSMPFYYQAWKEAFREVDINISEKEIYMREGEKREVTAKEVYKKFKREEPNNDLLKFIVKKKEEIYKEISEIRVFPGITELLTTLKNKNIKLALVTGSSRQTIQRFQEQDPLFKLFDVIVTGEDTQNGKPAPEPYIAAIEKLNAPTSNCYVVENAPLGIKSAVAANLTCFAVKNSSPLSENVLKEAGAHFVYKDIAQLKEHLIWADINIQLTEFIKSYLRLN